MWLREMFEESVDLVVRVVQGLPELGEILREGSADIAECITDGAVEMILKDNTNYKTSYEIRNEAQGLVNSAEAKLRSKSEEVMSKFELAETIYRELREKEEELLQNYSNYYLKDWIPRRENLEIFSNCYRPYLEKGFFDFGTYLGVLGTSLRKNIANDYLENAKSYKIDVDMQCAVYSNTMARLEAVINCMEEELKLLDVFKSAAKYNRCMTNEWVAKTLKQLIATPVCNTEGVLSDTYKRAIQQLKKEVSTQ